MASVDSQSDDTFLRFGLFGTAVLTWMGATDLWEFGDVGALTLSVGLLLASYLVGFVLLILACWRNIPRFARYAIPVALLVVVADYFQIHEANARLRGGDLTTDVLLFGEYTAHLVLEGQNPYGADLLEAYRAHRAPFNFSTPQIDGSLVGHLPYPALSFLVLVPALLVGLRASIVYPIFQVAALVALYFGVSPRYRPIILLPFLGETVYLGYALGGVSDPVWGFLLVCMVLAWDRPIGRGLLYGLAVSFKQHPWFLAPFLLVRIFWETKGSRTERVRAAALFTALSVGVFVVVNLPFVIWDPVEWFRGVFLPFLAPMQVYGQGPSVLTTVGWFTIPKSAHTVAVLGLLSIGLLAYTRHYHRVPYLLWMVPAVALWFGHRSLTSYWYFLAMPLAMDAFGVRRPVLASSEAPRRSFGPELALIGVLLTGFVASAVWGATRQPDLEISIVGPHEAIGNHISGTRVRVRNGTGRQIEPRKPASPVCTGSRSTNHRRSSRSRAGEGSRSTRPARMSPGLRRGSRGT
ncbi:MAG: hypothetical protein JRJ84_13035 [Deltaproteobacteria bacterium]|nr:hypothetical protein [Deltaproteobacteria bacterium]